ncbi:MAG: hypothetical protein A2X36_14450 [Elusimicrobia bacterium GWA2_69_24]|nr:MAG: hypothetical protein A2X36_14450 [Elusimicrobia bacterium GWA2_69_24]HBL18407.1 hypothetical protein [Elusimicrobiota bacterium]
MSEDPSEENPAPPRQKSLAGPILLLIVIMADVGFGIWGWNVYQEKRRQRREFSAVNVAKAPEQETTSPFAAPQGPRTQRGPDGLGYLIKEEGGAALPAAPGPDTRVTPEERERIQTSVRAYYRIKGDPRFASSRAIRDWTRDFLTYPDLRAIHERYQKDRNPIRFLADMTASPHFLRLRRKYLNAPDLQAFIGLLAAAPDVTAGSDTIIAKANLGAAIRDLAAFDAASGTAAGSRRGPSEMGKLRQHPKFGKWIEDSEAPEVSP